VRAALLVLCLASTAWAEDRAASRAAVEAADAHLSAKRWSEGERGYRRALELWADNPRALNDLAWLLVIREPAGDRRAAEALPLVQRALRAEPATPAYLDTLATVYERLGAPLRAARTEADALKRARGDLRRDLAKAQLGFVAQAWCEVAALDRDGLAQLLAWRAAAREALGQREPALRDLRCVRALRPGLSQVALAEGRLLVAAKRWRQALDALDAAARRGEGGPRRERWRGQALRALGRHAPAAEALSVASRAAPADYALRLEVAKAWRAAKRPTQVAAVVSRAVADLSTQRPLWGIRWRQRLRRVEAEAAEGALRAADSKLAGQRWRSAALRAWTLGVAARAQGGHADARIRALAAGDKSLPRAWPQLRRALAARYLGVRSPLRFRLSPLPESARGSRVALVDLDVDGDPDLVTGGHRLFVNDGRGHFRPGPVLPGAGGGVFADVDRDGDLDLFQLGRADRLLRNEGRLRFVDVTTQLGVSFSDGDPSEGAAWGDLNGDGFPDLYVANYETKQAKGTPDRLYLSDGRGGYRDASAQLKAAGVHCGRGVNMGDVDGDGDLDVFVSNYRLDPDFLWLNDGRGNLTNVAGARGVAGELVRGAYGHTIGSAWGDLDGDGDLDLVAANLAHPRFIDFSDKTYVYLQGPDGRFTDRREELGIAFEETHSDPTLFDADNDGDLDLFLTSVYPGRPSFLYRNLLVETGELRFRDESWVSGLRVFNGWGAAVADVDGDGDLDLAVASGSRTQLFLNEGAPGRSLLLRLRGRRSDTWGAGARVQVSFGGTRLTRELHLGHGTTSQSEPRVHVGLGPWRRATRVNVRWPSGRRSRHALAWGSHVIEEPQQ
jgi:tetratricopeptide (TPR) repeat protein